MSYESTIDELLTRACPSIRYRIRREILGEDESSGELASLQQAILEQELVQDVFSWQRPDGSFVGNGRGSFHHRYGMEVAFRICHHAALPSWHPVFTKGLDFFRSAPGPTRPPWQTGVGGGGGLYRVLLSLLGGEAPAEVTKATQHALAAFKFALSVDDFSSVVGKGKTVVFKKGSDWPGVWCPELLSLATRWITPEDQRLVAQSVDRVMGLCPDPHLDVKGKGINERGGITAYSVVWFRLSPDLPMHPREWRQWFSYMEQVARIGAVAHSDRLQRHVERLAHLLDRSGGWFTEPVLPRTFLEWDIYSGLALEPRRREKDVWEWLSCDCQRYDLAFRSLLILHYGGYLRI